MYPNLFQTCVCFFLKNIKLDKIRKKINSFFKFHLRNFSFPREVFHNESKDIFGTPSKLCEEYQNTRITLVLIASINFNQWWALTF